MESQSPSLAPQPAPELGATVSTRNAAIDHIRIVLTGLVILHHTAITYGGSGGWYWREEPNFSNMLLVTFNATNQSFFMGFFFLLAGYFTPVSFDRKGASRYLLDRFIRLGVPLLVYFFLISPFTIALGQLSEDGSLWGNWWHMITEGHFGPGPLWFAETLLIFALGYTAWRTFGPKQVSATLPSHLGLVIIAFVLAVVAFLVRLVVPVGEEVLWLQLGFFPAYIFLFAAGCATSASRALENVTLAKARPWMFVSVVMVAVVWWVIQHPLDGGRFEGGVSLNAVFYALWDPFTSWGFILGMLWGFRQFWSREIPLTRWLARRAFGAFIVHPPVVVAFSIAFISWTAPPIVKFFTVGTFAFIGSFMVASLLLSIPGANRIL